MNVNELTAKTVEATKEKKKSDDSVLSWVKFILLIIGLFLVFRFAIGITVISGNSMAPTLGNKDVIVTNNLLFTPDIDDIVQFRDVHGFDAIKRIIALPNDTVEIVDGVVYVNGDKVKEVYSIGFPNDMDLVTVAENSYFVIGDNRTPGESLDSRNSEFGFLPKERIKGKLLFSLFPLGFK
ncbi:signal peptidase I [Sporosarcina sp. FSL W8-0480]|uniref:signal peptidase I n=1 Tax=Sporosarcina sp. FSL W8-0480 TaxID=2954701 RepID=UPI0030DC33F0